MIKADQIFDARILIVDDQDANVLLLDKILRQAGYRNVNSTMEPRTVAALHRSQDFDLILLDLHMPQVDGFEVMEALKAVETDGYLPVLVVTAQPAHKLRALSAGARDFIAKPFDLIEVQTRIRNMIELRLLYRRLKEHNEILERTVAARTEALRSSEARFRAFARLSADWFWEQDAEGRLTEASGPVPELLGVQAPELIGTRGAMAPWDPQERAVILQHIEARRPFIDQRCHRIDERGRVQHLQLSGEPIFDEASRYRGFRGVGSDITERVQKDAVRWRGDDSQMG